MNLQSFLNSIITLIIIQHKSLFKEKINMKKKKYL